MGTEASGDNKAAKNRQFDGSGDFSELKLKVLDLGYKQISDELKRAEEQEHRVAFVACSMLLVVTSWTFTVNPPPKLDGFFPLVLVGVGIFCGLFAYVTVRYLLANGRTAALLFQDLIRVEELLGLHQPNGFVTEEMVGAWQNTPFQEPTVFSSVGKKWALEKVVRGTWPHTSAVILTGSLGVFALVTRAIAFLASP